MTPRTQTPGTIEYRILEALKEIPKLRRQIDFWRLSTIGMLAVVVVHVLLPTTEVALVIGSVVAVVYARIFGGREW